MQEQASQLSDRIEALIKESFENGVKTERIRVLTIISEEAKSQMAGWEKTDWIVALIEGRDK